MGGATLENRRKPKAKRKARKGSIPAARKNRKRKEIKNGVSHIW